MQIFASTPKNLRGVWIFFFTRPADWAGRRILNIHAISENWHDKNGRQHFLPVYSSPYQQRYWERLLMLKWHYYSAKKMYSSTTQLFAELRSPADDFFIKRIILSREHIEFPRKSIFIEFGQLPFREFFALKNRTVEGRYDEKRRLFLWV